ncbi:MAG: DnaJ family domain-containing protein [Candidatus Binatia bacterium]
MASRRPSPPTGAVGFIERLAEQRILEAQRKGEFDDLAGKGKPLELADHSDVPEDLRMAYHVLKNANVLPPEAELMKDIRILEDLLKHVEDEGERKSLAKSLQWKIIRLDILKRRSMNLASVRDYSRKIVAKLSRR